MLSASQIKAARALLDWSQSDLANEASISLATIRKIELGHISPRTATMGAIEQSLIASGVEFMDPDGVRRRPGGIFIFDGRAGGKDFLEDIRQTLRKNGGDLHIVSPTAEAFSKYCGLTDILEIDHLLKLNSSTQIKCILTDDMTPMISTPRLQFRSISKNYVDPVPFCVYASKYALAVPNGEPFCKLIVVESIKMASSARQHFLSLWEKAMPSAIAQAPIIKASVTAFR